MNKSLKSLKMLILSHISNMHDNPGHPECYDRLKQVYRDLKPIEFIEQDDTMGIIGEIIPKLDTQFFMRNNFKCPGCEHPCLYCKRCKKYGVVELDTDLYITDHTLYTIAGCIQCIIEGLNRIVSGEKFVYLLSRPPGHHADYVPSGFCFVNNSFFAAQKAISLGFKRPFILDWDFHHGNGTQKLVKGHRKISFASIHAYGENIYPGTGLKAENRINILNIPLNLNTHSRKTFTNDYMLEIMGEEIFPFIRNRNPDIIIISNGLDCHRNDSTFGLNVDDDFYLESVKMLLLFRVPLLFILEGGYSGKVVASVTKKIYNFMVTLD